MPTVRVMETPTTRPSDDECWAAFARRDGSYEGVFVAGVTSTGIFCRPGCPARTPRRDRVVFFADAESARATGFRPCLRCRPLERLAEPAWVAALLADVEAAPGCRFTDADLVERGLDPVRVRRWFRRHHGATFHAYVRARRLGGALAQLNAGDEVLGTGYDHGFESASGFADAFRTFFGDAPSRVRGRRLVIVDRLVTPLGPMLAGACDDGVCLLEFHDRRALPAQVRTLERRLDAVTTPGRHELVARLDVELTEWFAGTRRRFDVPVLAPGTPFQQRVWAALGEIPFGATRSYADLAERLGKPGAARAVGRANGDNRLAIVVPCHRVVRADGALCGYAGGLGRKRALIAHERRVTARAAGG